MRWRSQTSILPHRLNQVICEEQKLFFVIVSFMAVRQRTYLYE